MGFKSDAQRKGFFSNLRDKVHQTNIQLHEFERKRILKKVDKEKVKLGRQQEAFESQAQVRLAQNKLDKIKDVESRIKKEKFDKSRTGRFLNASKRGVSSAVEFEKQHGKGQIKQLKKIGKKVFK